VIRFRVAEALKRRGWTRYHLAKAAKITMTTAYRLSSPTAVLRRLDLATLDALCRTLRVQPGQLLQYVPDRPGQRR
jgi:DNA-binding Xre family transcriptional regulator